MASLTQRQRDAAVRFLGPNTSAALLKGQRAILDGEIVVLDGEGRSIFADLMMGRGEPSYCAFDLVCSTGAICATSLYWSANACCTNWCRRTIPACCT